MLIYELLFISNSGEPLIQKRYRRYSDDAANSVDIFMGQIRDPSYSGAPHFIAKGRRFFSIKRHDVHLVATTTHETSPIIIIELLSRIYQVCKDFCGTITEESLQLNIILILELLDEMLDNGYVQLLSTEKLKPYILSDPVPLKSPENMSPGLFGIEHRVAPSDAANKPVIRSKWDQEQRKNEIFLDVIERMSALVAANGCVVRCEINGQINMKSFLVGSPEIKLGLNEELTIAQKTEKKGYGNMVNLDSVKFHECVNTSEFSESKILTIRPPEGEFQVMTYNLKDCMTHGLPFRVFTYLKDSDVQKDLELGLKLRCEIPSASHAVNIQVHVPVSDTTTNISQQVSGGNQNVEFSPNDQKILWNIKKMVGKSEVSVHLKLINGRGSESCSRDLGPIAMDFEVSGFVGSNLQIRFLRVFDRERSYVPFRWVRYITTADSYVVKLNE